MTLRYQKMTSCGWSCVLTDKALNNCSLRRSGKLLCLSIAASVAANWVTPALGLPQDGQVTAGQADIEVQGDTMEVNQSTERVILEFESFDVDAGETVNFHQPGSDSVALNRVVGNDLSEIHGTINANGQVFLLNTNGVLFGQGAQVQVGGLMVTTLEMDDRNFLDGQYHLSGQSTQAIVNQGHISADGEVIVVGAELRNQGLIESAERVQLGASQAAFVSLDGSDIPLLIETDGDLGLVDNQGRIQAERIAIVSQQTIENSGVIRAVSAEGEGGEVVLSAAADVVVSGGIDASGLSGGEVEIRAQRYAQTASVDVRGDRQGGRVAVATESTLVVHSGAQVRADSEGYGDGGEITLISQNDAWLLPNALLSARGGDAGGDGGFVEVSGFEFVKIYGLADLSASRGQAGLFYIDPTDVAITDNGVNEGGEEVLDLFLQLLPNTTADSTEIDIDTITSALRNGTDVTISTQSSGGGAGDITFDASFDYDGYAGLATLGLIAERDIIFLPGATIFDGNPGDEGISLALSAARNIDMDSTVSLSLGAGSLSLDAGGDISIASLAGTALSALSNGTFSTLVDGAVNLDDAINITADDLLGESGRSLVLSAADLTINTSASGGDVQISSTTDNLSITNSGANSIAINDADAINLVDIQPQTGRIDVSSGGNSALTIANNIDLDGMTGDIALVSGGGLNVQGSLSDLSGAVDHSVGISLESSGDIVFAPTTRIDSGAAGLTLYSSAGDIQLGQVDGASVSLTAAGAIADGNAAAVNIYSADHALAAGGGIGTSNDPIESLGGSLSFATGALVAAAGDVYYTATAATNLVDSAVDGNLNINLDNGDLTLSETTLGPSGSFSADLANGAVRVNDLGLIFNNGLTLRAADITSASGNTAQITAALADLSLNSAASSAVIIDGDFSQLSLTVPSGRSLSLSDSNALQIDRLDNSGDLSLSAGADILITDTSASWGNSLALISPTDIGLPTATAVDVVDGLSISAANISDGDNVIVVQAAQLDLDLSPSLAHTFNTQVSSLSAQVDTAQSLTINESDSLVIESLTLAGDGAVNAGGDIDITALVNSVAGELAFAAGGNLLLAGGGLQHAGALRIDAQDVLSAGATAPSLQADTLDLSLSAAATSQTIATQVATLDVTHVGTVPLQLSNTGDLYVNNLNSNADASLSSTADLTLQQSVSAVAGELSLSAADQLIIADVGLQHGSTLNLTADSLIAASGGNVILQAQQGNLRVSGAQDLVLQTQLEGLSYQGAGALSLQEVDDLAIGVLQVGTNSNIVAGGDFDLSALSNIVGADLTLTAGGEVLLAGTGLQHATLLSITAQDLIAVGSAAPSLQADTLDLNLSAAVSAQTIATQVANLDLSYAGMAPLQISNTGDLQVLALDSNVATSLSSSADLTLQQAVNAVAGELSLNAGDQLILPATGVQHSDALSLSGYNIVAADGGVLSLSASSVDLELRGAQDLVLQTQVDQLAYRSSGLGALTLSNDRDLNLSVLLAAQLTALNLDINGLLSVPAAGLDAGNAAVAISATDLVDGDRSVQLTGRDLSVSLSNLAADSQWDLSAERADLEVNGRGSLELNSDRSLRLSDLNADGRVLTVSDGNLNVHMSSGDLLVDGNVSANDAADDGLAHGQVHIVLDSGSLLLGSTSATTIEANTLAESTAANEDYALSVTLGSSADSNGERGIAIGGAAPALVRAVGGDILLQLREPGTTTGVTPYLSYAAGSQIQAYNDANDPLTGQVLINGNSVEPAAEHRIAAQRTLAIITGEGPAVIDEEVIGESYDEILQEHGDPEVDPEPDSAGRNNEPANSDVQFAAVFGRCDELERNSQQRCRIERALKSFLSHWLVGGELPPRTELR